VQNAIHSTCRREKQQNTNNERENEVPGAKEVMRCWSGCFTGGAAVDAGGGDMAPNSGAPVSSDGEREILPLPLPSSFVFSFSVSFTSGCPFVLLVLFLKNFPSLVSSFPLIFPFSFYFTPLFSVTFLFVPPSCAGVGCYL